MESYELGVSRQVKDGERKVSRRGGSLGAGLV
jgi:hypothetical protein